LIDLFVTVWILFYLLLIIRIRIYKSREERVYLIYRLLATVERMYENESHVTWLLIAIVMRSPITGEYRA